MSFAPSLPGRDASEHTSRFWGHQLAGLAITFGLGPMAAPATGVEVCVRGGTGGNARLEVIELGSKSVTAIHTRDPVERWRLAQFQGDQQLDGDVPGPAGEVAQIDPVVEHPVEKRVPGDLPGHSGSYGSDAGKSCTLLPR
jgi:hypothetical protein